MLLKSIGFALIALALLTPGLVYSHVIREPDCSELHLEVSHPDFRVISTKLATVINYTSVAGFDFCNVSAILTHPGANDVVYTELWLPLAGWNGRFVATGGGGLVAGFETSLPPFV